MIPKVIKKFLKLILSERQYETLKIAKSNICLFPECLIGIIMKAIPDKLGVIIKSNSQILRKMDYQGCDILLNIDSKIEYEIRANSCKKEPQTVKWIETFFMEGDVFYDIGANIGAYSLVASKFLSGNISVYAFEPGFTNFSQLCKNIFINKCQGSITPLQIALSDKTRIEVFNYNNLSPGGALHALGNAVGFTGDAFDPVFKQPVISYRIDDLIRQFRIPVPNHIKIDVDGIEFEILKGGQDTLDNPLVKSMLLEINEMHKETTANIINFLLLKGFKFQSKHKGINADETGPYSQAYNYIFKR